MSGSQPEDRGSSPLGGNGSPRKMPTNSQKTPVSPGFFVFRAMRDALGAALYFASLTAVALLNAIYKARQAIDEARNTLAKACERVELPSKRKSAPDEALSSGALRPHFKSAVTYPWSMNP
jgi:hypothetical protein